LEIVNLVPSKSKENGRNNVYVKNFPRDFSDDDLRKLFENYGEISSAMVCCDDKGSSKGFGYVCFVHPGNAVEAIKDLKEKEVSFPGLPPVYVNFLMKKEDRSNFTPREKFTLNSTENAKFMVSAVYDPEIVIK
jgi:RNA recognition motif-containing protein